jgi:hypothetical protein
MASIEDLKVWRHRYDAEPQARTDGIRMSVKVQISKGARREWNDSFVVLHVFYLELVWTIAVLERNSRRLRIGKVDEVLAIKQGWIKSS